MYDEIGELDASAISAASLIERNAKFDIVFTSILKRSIRTAEIILNELNCLKIPIYSSWRLNERHYGALTGFNKRQVADIYGEEQVNDFFFLNLFVKLHNITTYIFFYFKYYKQYTVSQKSI